MGARYQTLFASIVQAVKAWRKIFHGQVTDSGLSRTQLLALVADLREWCTLLAKAADTAYGYDGVGRDSYRKGKDATLHTRFKVQIKSVPDYEAFLKANVARQKQPKKT
jgi:hypothetical protein